MHLSSTFQEKLRNSQITFSSVELEDGLRYCMMDFIEERMEFGQLIAICEHLKKTYAQQLSKKFLDAVNTLYELNKELNDPKKEKPSSDQIMFLVDDFLDSFT